MRLYLRDEKIKQVGSPFYPISLPAIAASGMKQYTIENSSELKGADRFSPLDWMEIVNNDSVDIQVAFGLGSFIVIGGTIRTISNNWFDKFTITNLSASTAVTADKIKITCRREPITLDRLARQMKT